MTENSRVIYHLGLLANRYGMYAKIANEILKENTELKSLIPYHQQCINSISCMWFNKKGRYPFFAFEPEQQISPLTATEKFSPLIKLTPQIADKRRLILITTGKNENNFHTHVNPGHLHSKIRYLFEETLAEHFEELMKENDFTSFEALLTFPVADNQVTFL